MPDGDAERVAALHLIEATGQSVRKRIEEAFGWIKTIAGQEKDQSTENGIVSDGHLPSRPQPTIWFGYPNCCRNWRDRSSCGQLIGRSWIIKVDSRHRHDLDHLRFTVRKAKREPFFNSLLRRSFHFHR